MGFFSLLTISKLLIGIWGAIKGGWGIFKFLGSKTGGVLTALTDTIKEIGITKVLTYYFMLGFLFKALYNVIFVDHNAVLFILKLASVLATSENTIIGNVRTLEAINRVSIGNIFLVFHIYISILGAIFIFKYMIELISGWLSTIVSNDSFGGFGPFLISLIFLMMLEIIGLGVIALGDTGTLSEVEYNEVLPLRGFYTLLMNFDDVLHPFTDKESLLKAVDIVGFENLTVASSLNTTEVEVEKGFIELMIKKGLGLLGKIF